MGRKISAPTIFREIWTFTRDGGLRANRPTVLNVCDIHEERTANRRPYDLRENWEFTKNGTSRTPSPTIFRENWTFTRDGGLRANRPTVLNVCDIHEGRTANRRPLQFYIIVNDYFLLIIR